MISNFIENEEATCEFEGLPLSLVFDNNRSLLNKMLGYENAKEYTNCNVKQMGEEAEDLATRVAPIVLKIQITTVILDVNASVRPQLDLSNRSIIKWKRLLRVSELSRMIHLTTMTRKRFIYY